MRNWVCQVFKTKQVLKDCSKLGKFRCTYEVKRSHCSWTSHEITKCLRLVQEHSLRYGFQCLFSKHFLNTLVVECILIITGDFWFGFVMINMLLATGVFWNVFRTDIPKNKSGWLFLFFLILNLIWGSAYYYLSLFFLQF